MNNGSIKITRVLRASEMLPALREFEEMMDQVTRRAYQLFESRGEEHGRDWDDWLEAEKEILGTPAAAVAEDDERFEIRIALPGFDASQIRITTGPHDLVLYGRKTTGDWDGLRVMRGIRYRGPVDVSGVRASFKDGVLAVVAPKEKG